ncbi:M23 family metallopeptidase [Sulfurimonas sp. HSL-1716]|uniref:M23 family metallopeptidase n=1 Tax=Hydrocurvibacter sulfurireducens TaxID=3131937 RepID=UPI0031F7647F
MRRRRNSSSLLVLIFFIALIGGAVFIFNSSMFERNAPVVKLDNNGYWNLKDPLHVNISDDTGILSYNIVLKVDDKTFNIADERFMAKQNNISFELKAPKQLYRIRTDSAKLIITARDASKWDFLKGNEVKKEFNFIVDSKRPELISLANSYSIQKGGCAVVIFKAKDENLKSIKISTNFGKDFLAQPFYKKGYYISLIAWPIKENSFRATIVVKDMAGNISQEYVRLYLKDRKYKESHITLKDKFLDGKIAELSNEFEETDGVDDRIERFKIINEKVRAKNEALIHKVTSKVSQNTMISDFDIKPMYPLKNAAPVASFGDHRIYSYQGKVVSEAYHMGLDLASVQMGSITTQNPGHVVFANYNGLYGNNPIIDHGLGLYTLYGHCSSLSVNEGDNVKAGEEIAKTGMTGYAMGDHLHFGVLVQGVEVRPEEWMDKHWMKVNIEDIIAEAKKIIDRQ